MVLVLAIDSGAFSARVLQHLVHELLEVGIGQYLVHQSHRQRLVGLVAPAEEHDLPRARMADGLEQALVPLDVVGEAELRRRDAELRRSRAVAQVAGERDLHPAAEAVAVDHRHRGLERALDRVQHAVEQVVVLPYGLFVGALRVEFGDIGPCRERLGAGAAERHAAHLRVGVELLHRRRDAAPHGVVDRVAPAPAGRTRSSLRCLSSQRLVDLSGFPPGAINRRNGRALVALAPSARLSTWWKKSSSRRLNSAGSSRLMAWPLRGSSASAGGGNGALHQQIDLDAGLFLVARHDQRRHVHARHLGGQVVERRPAALHAEQRVHRAERRVLLELAQVLGEARADPWSASCTRCGPLP